MAGSPSSADADRDTDSDNAADPPLYFIRSGHGESPYPQVLSGAHRLLAGNHRVHLGDNEEASDPFLVAVGDDEFPLPTNTMIIIVILQSTQHSDDLPGASQHSASAAEAKSKPAASTKVSAKAKAKEDVKRWSSFLPVLLHLLPGRGEMERGTVCS